MADAPDIQGGQQPLDAETQALLAPSTQAQPLQPPQIRPELPGIVSLLGSLLKPATATAPQGFDPTNPNGPQLARPSRLPAFEQFIGTFMNSMAQGMAASGHGPGANERGAAAAMMAPYQTRLQNFQVQQQAAAQQAEIEKSRAQTAQAQMETQLAPKQLQMQEELKQLQLQYENDWKTAMIGNQSRALDLKQAHDTWTEAVAKQKVGIEQGKLNVAQELARYKGMDTDSQIAYRSAMAEALNDKVAIAASLANQMNQLKTAQSVEAYQKAYNDVGIMANLARSIGVAPGIDQIVSSMPNPINLPQAGNTPKITPKAPKSAPKGGGTNPVDSLVGKYGG